jgi:hypothetical protein
MTEKIAITTRHRRHTAPEIEQLVEEFVNSGMRADAFCRSRGLGRGTLVRYLKKRNEQPRRTKVAKGRLMPVEVVSNPQKADEGGSGLLLVMARGHRVEVQPGFDETTLRQLLDVLEWR